MRSAGGSHGRWRAANGMTARMYAIAHALHWTGSAGRKAGPAGQDGPPGAARRGGGLRRCWAWPGGTAGRKVSKIKIYIKIVNSSITLAAYPLAYRDARFGS